MSIRRLQYQIDFVHILTFQLRYKFAVYPWFGLENVEYAIDDENTMNESIRLIFKNDNLVIAVRKEAMIMVFEGEYEAMMNSSGPLSFFWDMFEKVKAIEGFVRPTRHTLSAAAVKLHTQEYVLNNLENNPYLSKNPFGKLDDFGCNYHYRIDDTLFRFQFGNYSPKDIKQYDLSPFRTPANRDLKNGVGEMARIEVEQHEENPTFTKYKSLLTKAHNEFRKFNLL